MQPSEIPAWFDPAAIYKCQGRRIREGQTGMFLGDLEFDEERFWLVLEWQLTHDGEIPSSRRELLMQHLTPPTFPGGTWEYSEPLELPPETQSPTGE